MRANHTRENQTRENQTRKMSKLEKLTSFVGEDVLVVGGATGMGAAAARMLVEAGARVTVLDLAEVAFDAERSISVDLASEASVHAVLDELNQDWRAVFACAGVADGTPRIVQINFIGQRTIVDGLMARGNLRAGSAVVMISSVAGMSWKDNLEQVQSVLDCHTWQDAEAWLAANEGTETYRFSKQAMCGYASLKSMDFLTRGVRINSVMPGPTDTPLARANADIWLGFGAQFRKQVGVKPLDPEQVASVMIFLASDMASGVNGCNMLVDFGHIEASTTGVYAEPAYHDDRYAIGK